MCIIQLDLQIMNGCVEPYIYDLSMICIILLHNVAGVKKQNKQQQQQQHSLTLSVTMTIINTTDPTFGGG